MTLTFVCRSFFVTYYPEDPSFLELDYEEVKELIRQLAMQEGLFFKPHLP